MNRENVLQIHKASLNILEDIGIEFQDKEILDILSRNGVKIQNNRAYFTEYQVMENLSKAPNEFTLYARNKKYRS